jgi:hypothetical protein
MVEMAEVQKHRFIGEGDNPGYNWTQNYLLGNWLSWLKGRNNDL